MEQIKAWKASDGRLFESQQAANSHELYLKFRVWFEEEGDIGYDPDAADVYAYLHTHHRILLPLLEAFKTATTPCHLSITWNNERQLHNQS